MYVKSMGTRDDDVQTVLSKKLKSKGELLQFRVVHMYRAMRSNQHLKHTHTHMHTHITPPFVVSKSLL